MLAYAALSGPGEGNRHKSLIHQALLSVFGVRGNRYSLSDEKSHSITFEMTMGIIKNQNIVKNNEIISGISKYLLKVKLIPNGISSWFT